MTGNKSVVVTTKGDDFKWSVVDRSIPEAVPGSAVIQVLHAPTVQYSKSQFGTQGYPAPLPLVPGANGVGRVHALGSDSTTLKKGDLVLINSVVTPRDAANARLLLAFMTDRSDAAGKLMEGDWRDGTFAQYVRIPLENAFLLDEQRLCGELGYSTSDLWLIQTCAVGFGGLDDGNIKAGDTVIVAPATGRFSGATVLTALAMGATVIAAGRRQEPLNDLVKAMGKDKASLRTVLLTGELEKDTELFKQAVGPRGADFYVDWSPPALEATPTYFSAALNVMRRGATVCLMGAPRGAFSIPYTQIMLQNLVLRGRFMYEPEQIQRCIVMAESGKLPLGDQAGMRVVASYGLEQFVQAMDAAADYPGWGQVVEIVPAEVLKQTE